MVQPRLFMNMEPPPLDFSALNNYPRTDFRTKGPPQKANSPLFFTGIATRPTPREPPQEEEAIIERPSEASILSESTPLSLIIRQAWPNRHSPAPS